MYVQEQKHFLISFQNLVAAAFIFFLPFLYWCWYCNCTCSCSCTICVCVSVLKSYANIYKNCELNQINIKAKKYYSYSVRWLRSIRLYFCIVVVAITGVVVVVASGVRSFSLVPFPVHRRIAAKIICYGVPTNTTNMLAK